MPWWQDDPGDQSEPRGGTYHENQNPNVESSGSGCFSVIIVAAIGGGGLASLIWGAFAAYQAIKG